MPLRFTSTRAFTLIELMVVVAIVGLLAGLAMASYRHFTGKAIAVEAEVALAEVNRLEQLHHANHGLYSDNLSAIGFAPKPPLKYYQVVVQVQHGGKAFQAMAFPLAHSANQVAVALTRTRDGQVEIMKGDPAAIAKQMGAASSGNGVAGGNGVLGGSGSDSGGTPDAGGSKGGSGCDGDAKLAEDGYLDMNFCFKGSSRGR
jgi:prepilin-type N-terminal cleavage/methylation domain-containing protein